MRRYRRRAEGRRLRGRLVLAALLCVLLAAWVDSRLEPVVQDLTANEAKARAVQLVSEAVEKSLAGQEEPVSAMVSIQYAESGEIASLTTDMAQLNVLKSRLLAGVQQELGESVHIDAQQAEDALVKLVMSGGLVTVNRENARLARRYLVRTFMGHVPFEQWTVKSLASANEELGRLVRDFANEALRSRTEETTIVPVRLPAAGELRVPLGDTVHEQVESRSEFVRGRFYSGWFKSLFEAESFASYTGEYLLARLLNTSPHIVWWNRLHPQDGAYIYYTPRDRYFPDFVALDDEGVHWIIEGKDARGRQNDVVQLNRRAAEGVVRRLMAHDDFCDERWGYLIAYEDDVVSSDSWSDLKAKADPVCTK